MHSAKEVKEDAYTRFILKYNSALYDGVDIAESFNTEEFGVRENSLLNSFTEMKDRRTKMKTLVVYYSQSGNAQWMAERIASALSADMLRLIPKKAYPEKGFGKYFFGGGSAVIKEAPELEPYQVNLEQYGQIVFVTPVWAG